MTNHAVFICSDCHEVKPILTAGGTGYALSKDNRKVCYACCAIRDRAEMMQGRDPGLYLTFSPAMKHSISNWPGTLSFEVIRYTKGKHACFAGRVNREDAWFVGPDGRIWHAVVRGDMQLARCKPTKYNHLPV